MVLFVEGHIGPCLAGRMMLPTLSGPALFVFTTQVDWICEHYIIIVVYGYELFLSLCACCCQLKLKSYLSNTFCTQKAPAEMFMPNTKMPPMCTSQPVPDAFDQRVSDTQKIYSPACFILLKIFFFLFVSARTKSPSLRTDSIVPTTRRKLLAAPFS